MQLTELTVIIVLTALGACLWLDWVIGHLSNAMRERLDYLFNYQQRSEAP